MQPINTYSLTIEGIDLNRTPEGPSTQSDSLVLLFILLWLSCLLSFIVGISSSWVIFRVIRIIFDIIHVYYNN